MRYMIFDRWGNPLGDLPYAIKAIRTRATDGTDTLDVTTIGEINKDERIVFKDSMGRWAEYVCQSTQTARAAGMPVTVAYCAGGIAELSRTYIEDKRNRNANAKACLAKALEGTRWTVGTVETGTITGTADLSFYHCTVLEAVQKTADTYGLEVQTEVQPDPTGNRIGQRIIHLLEHRGSPTPRNASNTAKTSPRSNETSTAATSSPASTAGAKASNKPTRKAKPPADTAAKSASPTSTTANPTSKTTTRSPTGASWEPTAPNTTARQAWTSPTAKTPRNS